MSEGIKDKLESLESLLKQGIISQSEYEKNRHDLLNEIDCQSAEYKEKEDPLEILRKSLALGKVSSNTYKKNKKCLEQTTVRSLKYSDEYHILRMRLAYGEIKLDDFWQRYNELIKEEKKEKKRIEKEEKKNAEKDKSQKNFFFWK